jgi:hypothetical protein
MSLLARAAMGLESPTEAKRARDSVCHFMMDVNMGSEYVG